MRTAGEADRLPRAGKAGGRFVVSRLRRHVSHMGQSRGDAVCGGPLRRVVDTVYTPRKPNFCAWARPPAEVCGGFT
jgi:hypothetical protein